LRDRKGGVASLLNAGHTADRQRLGYTSPLQWEAAVTRHQGEAPVPAARTFF
jgi:hypothetical protein